MGCESILAVFVILSTGCASIFGLDDPIGGLDAPREGGSSSCNASGLTCSGTTVAQQCGNHCWVGCSEPVTGMVAASRCSQWKTNGKLAPFKSQIDQDCFRTEIQPAGDAWTGLVQSSSAGSVGSNWSWNGDNQSLSFMNWRSSQPDDADGVENGTEQCASIVDTQNTWEDTTCATVLPFGCRDSNGGGDVN